MNAVSKNSLVAMLAALTCGAAAQKLTSIEVTTTVHDVDVVYPNNPFLMRSDHYNGFQRATYTNTGKVTSVIFTSDGSWQLYLGNQSLRTIWLTLASQGAPIPDGSYSANVEVFSKCWDGNGNQTGLLVIAPGTSNSSCSLGADFSSGRNKYRLVMNPLTAPGTGWATVSCNGPIGGSTCNSWTIVPNTTAANPAIANLYEFANNGSLIYIGTYHNTYRIDVTKP